MASVKLISKYLDAYITLCDTIDKLNDQLESKKIRKPNFPSEISENIVKFVYNKNNKNLAKWDVKGGDLITLDGLKIEVKAYSSNGPTSFGPTEKWDILYIVDAKRYLDKRFKVYEINLKSSNIIIQNLKVSKLETYEQQCKSGRRPRINPINLIEQLGNNCNLIFNDTIHSLN